MASKLIYIIAVAAVLIGIVGCQKDTPAPAATPDKAPAGRANPANAPAQGTRGGLSFPKNLPKGPG